MLITLVIFVTFFLQETRDNLFDPIYLKTCSIIINFLIGISIGFDMKFTYL